MALTLVDLALVRDEIGTSSPPTDTELDDSYDELHHWLLVALRVLKRRRAALAAGGVQAVSIPGAVSVTLRSDLASLDRQIVRLEARYATETGEVLDEASGSTVLRRRVAR